MHQCRRELSSFLAPVALAGLMLLTACGGSSGDSNNNAPSNSNAPSVPPGGSSNPADELSTQEIQRSAADAMGRMFNLETNELGAAFDPESDSPLDESPDDGNAMAMGSDEMDMNLNTSLGIADEDVESITRDGNFITIDLDENALCADQMDSQDSCLSAVQHITVTIDAASDDSGVVSYLYRGEPAIRVGYAPNAGSYELRLDPWLVFLIDQREFIWDEEAMPEFPESFSGAYRLTVEADAEFPDELGSMTLELSEPMNIQSLAENVSIEAEASALWSIGMTPTGGVFEFGSGRSKISAPWDIGEGHTAEFFSPGFSGRADIREDNGLLTVSNFGMSNGPFTITVDSGDMLRIALEKFGFTVAESDNEVVLTGDLNLNVLLNNTMGTLTEDNSVYEALLDVLAPSGSAFSINSEGPTELLRGGPFSVTLNQTDELGTNESNVVVQPGGCFASAGDASEGAIPIQLVDCGG